MKIMSKIAVIICSPAILTVSIIVVILVVFAIAIMFAWDISNDI